MFRFVFFSFFYNKTSHISKQAKVLQTLASVAAKHGMLCEPGFIPKDKGGDSRRTYCHLIESFLPRLRTNVQILSVQ